MQVDELLQPVGQPAEADVLVPAPAEQLLDVTDTRPLIDRTLPMEQARDGFAALLAGDVFGKVVLTR